MSSSVITTLNFASAQVIMYLGTPLLITGVIGGLLNIIVFLSLKTFRQNSCAFYMIVMSGANIGQLMAGLLSRIVITGFNVDWTLQSRAYCKIRISMLYICSLTSLTCMCLTAIDQFMATSTRVHWQQWSNIRIAHRLSAVLVVVWILHGIPPLLYFDHIVSSVTGAVVCTTVNTIYQYYYMYGYVFILVGILPASVTVLFGFLAYQNVKQIAYRTVPLVRRQLDKQLTSMVLVQVVCSFFALIPCMITTLLLLQNRLFTDPMTIAEVQLVNYVNYILYYFYFASPFYIYICVSQRFRHQFIHVIFEVHLKRWRPPRMATNQVSVMG